MVLRDYFEEDVEFVSKSDVSTASLAIRSNTWQTQTTCGYHDPDAEITTNFLTQHVTF